MPSKAKTAAGSSGPKTIQKYGLKLKLPAKVPAEVYFVFEDLAEGARIPYIPLLKAYIGEEQTEDVRDAGLDMDQLISLVDEVQSQYQVGTGK